MSFLTGILFLNSCVKDPTIPVLNTGQVTDITINSAKISGEVTDDGGAEVTARGFCWGISTKPTMQDYFIPSGTGPGEFSSTIADLQPNTPYFIRAFAQNRAGIAYGNEVTFTTGIAAPQVTTSPVSGITASSAVCGGTISYNGGAEITGRGVCWSTSPDPDLEDSFTTSYTGAATFISTLTNLLPGTKYYVRAYVKNSAWTIYGEPKVFNSKLADIEGNLYSVINIGTQVWMAENLRTTKFNDNTTILNVAANEDWIVLTTPAYCWFSNDSQYKVTFGALYNWYTVGTGKLCPDGWHVPTDAEYMTLESALAMSSDQLELWNWRGTDQGTQIKSTSGWIEGGNGTNSSGFNGLSGGYRFGATGAFNALGMITYWWSSEHNVDQAVYRRVDYDNGAIYRSVTSKRGGKYIRCIKN
ncbi:MAG: hypothetical protein IH591_13250 [Bacteroidales bacterium]|nr:hypothetical protein [Bacteroidales bacterium]